MRYNPAEIEPKWQTIWEDREVFRTSTDLEELRQKPKYYVLDMFPYPSGSGLHVGHAEGYTATDVARPLQADDRPQRAAPDGLGRFRPAC